MPRTKKRVSLLSLVSILLAAMGSSVLVTLAFGGLIPSSLFRVLFFVGFFVGSALMWYWFVFVRPAELKKKLPITSKEWQRRQKEFYDSLPR
jgi:hypothetical protein